MIVLLRIIVLAKLLSACSIERCSLEYSKNMNSQRLEISSNAGFCKILFSYVTCLRAYDKYCISNPQYHTLTSILSKELSHFECHKFSTLPLSKKQCHFHQIEPNIPKSCLIWGQMHGKAFDNNFYHSTFPGTFTMLDNKWLRIQISSQIGPHNLIQIKQISVIIKRFGRCFNKTTYLVRNDMEFLPDYFVDGSHIIGSRHDSAVKIDEIGKNMVVIHLNYLSSNISILKVDEFLSINVVVHEKLIKDDETHSQVCLDGFPNEKLSFMMKNVFSNVDKFSKCYNLTLSTSITEATKHCKALKTTDSFYDTCVFDLLFSNNKNTTTLSAFYQREIEARVKEFRKYYSLGREDFHPYQSTVFECPLMRNSDTSYEVFNLLFLICVIVWLYIN
uniref:RGM_C domain-containing protein n=1 Tax=Rhabditophanes sp. KR3021 TaxID=114890 RepID=A0AC35UF26_9BILA